MRCDESNSRKSKSQNDLLIKIVKKKKKKKINKKKIGCKTKLNSLIFSYITFSFDLTYPRQKFILSLKKKCISNYTLSEKTRNKLKFTKTNWVSEKYTFSILILF